MKVTKIFMRIIHHVTVDGGEYVRWDSKNWGKVTDTDQLDRVDDTSLLEAGFVAAMAKSKPVEVREKPRILLPGRNGGLTGLGK